MKRSPGRVCSEIFCSGFSRKHAKILFSAPLFFTFAIVDCIEPFGPPQVDNDDAMGGTDEPVASPAKAIVSPAAKDDSSQALVATADASSKTATAAGTLV
jgi:hypothetical protein